MKRFSIALAMVLVVSVPAVVAWAQQPVAPAAPAEPAAPVVAPAPAAGPAPAASKIDKGDTAWMLTSSALVLLMTAPGLALFYGGMVRQKNALATLMQSFIILAVISIQWILWGYSLAFGPDKGGIIGGLDLAFAPIRAFRTGGRADEAIRIPGCKEVDIGLRRGC